MRRVQCYACGKGYDYDDDGFCPKCGAFNLPPRSKQISADGAVIRVDGLNERNHANSFLHEELHAEECKRRKLGLDRPPARKSAVLERKPADNEWRNVEKMLPSISKGKKKVPPLFLGFVALVIFFNLLLPLLMFAW